MSLPNPKPFSMQSPDTLIELSGGNKQKLLQMVQVGSIDETSAVLAAMKIDKIRAAAQIEQAPQQTVFQNAFGLGAPPAPQAAPAGLGATPQGMQMANAAPAAMGAPAPQGPVQMAGGGLTTLPLPDDMYDEQSFAGGGIVAFASGGQYEEQIKGLRENIKNPKFSYAEKQRATQELTRLLALPKSSGNIGLSGKALTSLDAASRAANVAAGYYDNTKGVNPDVYNYVAAQDLNIPRTTIPRTQGIPFPTPSTSSPAAPAAVVPPPPPAVLRPRAPVGPSTATTPDDDYGLPKAPEAFDQTKNFDEILKMMGPAPKSTRMSAEEQAAQRNDDIGMALLSAASAGLSGGSKTFLGALGDAGKGAMPALTESAKERKARDREERQADFDQAKTEYGARGTAAAATRAEKSEAQKYGLTLAQFRQKVANDKAALELEQQKQKDMAPYYRAIGAAAGRDNQGSMVDRYTNALVALKKDPNDIRAQSEITAIRETQGRSLGLGGDRLTAAAAMKAAGDAQARGEIPKGMTVQQYALQLMEATNGGANPIGGDINLGTMTAPR